MIQIQSFAKKKKDIVNNNGGGGFANNTTTIINNGITELDTHTLWGQPFNGKNDVSGDLTDVGNIFASGDIETTGDISATNGNFTNVDATNIDADNINVSSSITSPYAEIASLLSTDIVVDNLTVTKAAHFFSLIIDEIKSVGGQIILTPANAVVDKVTEQTNYYTLYWRCKDNDGKEISNQFATNDLVVCQTFNAATGTSYNVNNHFYWRKCVGTGRTSFTENGESVDYHYIRLSKVSGEYDTNSNAAPEPDDKIVLLGNTTDTTRQNAIILSAYNNQFLDSTIVAPSIVQYKGINTFNLSNFRLNVISNGLNSFKGNLTTEAGTNVQTAFTGIGQTIGGITNSITTINNTLSGHTTDINNNSTDITAIQNALSQLGGANLIHNSAFVNNVNGVPFKWASWGTPTTREITKIANRYWLHLVTNDKWQGIQQRPVERWGTNNVNTLQPNSTYTISLDAYCNSGTSYCGCIIHFCDVSGTNISQINKEWAITSTITKYTYTFTTPENSAITAFNVMLGSVNSAHTGNIYISHPKIELGEIATDWQPSAYDFADDLNALKDELYNNSLFQDIIQSGNFFTNNGGVTSQTLTYNATTNTYKMEQTDVNSELGWANDPSNFKLDGGIKYAVSLIPTFSTQYQNAQITVGVRRNNAALITNELIVIDSQHPTCTSYNNQTLTAYLDLREYNYDDLYLWVMVESEPVSQTPSFGWHAMIKDITIWKYTAVESQIEQTANQISLRVTETENDLNNLTTSVGEISVKADEVSARVNDTEMKINDGQITLNGNTEINGTLNINNNSTGFILSDSNGANTIITPETLVSYDTFINSNEVPYNYNKNLTSRVLSGDTTISFDGELYLGTIVSGNQLKLSNQAILITKIVDGSATSVNVSNLSITYTVKDGSTVLGTYSTTSSNISSVFKTINFTANHSTTVYIHITATVPSSSENVDYICTTKFKSTITCNEIARLGSDGYACKFSSGRDVYMSEDAAVFHYDDYGLRVTSGGIQKLSNGNWYPINNITNIRELTTTSTTGSLADEFVIIRSNASISSVATYNLPNNPPLGKKIYFKCQKSGSANIKIASNSTNIIQPNDSTAVNNYAIGQASAFALYDGIYWNIFYCG